MKTFLLSTFLLATNFLNATNTTEAYRDDYWLNFKIVDKSGKALSDIPVTFKIDSEVKTLQTDEHGIVRICITCTSTCTRKNNRKIWEIKTVKVLQDGEILKCFKNWKKLFSEYKMVTKILLYENGTLTINKK